MESKKPSVLRVDLNYTAVQSTFWMGYCTISGFTAIYLSFRGLSNTEIGLTTSLTSIIAIVMQFFVSAFCDKHMNIAIKKVIAIIYIAAIAGAAALAWIPVPIALMIVIFAFSVACDQSINALLNAQMMQFNNMGIQAHFGWPRGVGSLCYAASAYILGIVVETYSAGILMPLFITVAIISTVALLFMPNPMKNADPSKLSKKKDGEKVTSYFEMLKSNPTLILYLCAVIINSLGQAGGYTFMIRVIEGLGGGTSDFGISELIRAGVEVPMLFASTFILAKFKAQHLITFSFFCTAMRVFLVAAAPNLGFIYLASAANILCTGINIFSAVIFINSIVKAREKVRAQALSVLCASIGSIIGNFYAGFMIDNVGLHPMLFLSSAICVTGGVLMIFVCRLYKKKFVNTLN